MWCGTLKKKTCVDSKHLCVCRQNVPVCTGTHVRERFECTHGGVLGSTHSVVLRQNKVKKQHPRTHTPHHHPDQHSTAQYNHKDTNKHRTHTSRCAISDQKSNRRQQNERERERALKRETETDMRGKREQEERTQHTTHNTSVKPGQH